MNTLLIDIGNTRVKWRFVEHPDAGAPHGSEHSLAVIALDDADRAFAVDAPQTVDEVLVSNVASEASEAILVDAVVRRWPEATVHRVRSQAEACGVVNGYREPAQLGPDRWMALLGAHALHAERSMLVCSFGTATTIDLLLVRGPDAPAHFFGGLILPGIDPMRAALATNTARLPLSTGRVVDFAIRTDDAIATGVMAAQVGAVEMAWRRALPRATAAGFAPPTLCLLAGGRAADVAPFLPAMDATIETVHDLVLRGLAAVARRHRGAAAR